ncbi:MAG TPA: Ig-like domain-containing protein [Ignavibacteria bacterium]|nr:Ig-like domain-containing protein [Ignavibacteria bacterium]HRJ99971.1 Ig-like domain-containing protein [Ignavibacteria bacterium]
MKNFIFYFSVFVLSVSLFCSCANQLPPEGGKNDTDPPRLTYIFPRPNSTGVKGNKIILKFNEYVDRRSFEESFFISPLPAKGFNFEWSGREVEIVFNENFGRDRTYVIIIGKDLRDVRGGNNLSEPAVFAFSTGSKLDKGNISGKVFSDNYDRVKVLLYHVNDTTAIFPDPSVKIPDYVTQVSADGNYTFTNLPDGKFRLYAVIDEDRNNVYDKGIDKAALLPDDPVLTGDSISVSGLHFALNLPDTDIRSVDFLNTLKPDSAGYVFTNYPENNLITPFHKFYFYFEDKYPDKKSIVDNFIITDTSSGKKYNPVFNWVNDSLLEVFSTEPFEYNSNISVGFNVSPSEKYRESFKVYEKDKFGKISGRFLNAGSGVPVILKLYNLTDRGISYTSVISDTSAFSIGNIIEGKYMLFAFRDDNSDGSFDKGIVYPFKAPERFLIYDKDFEIKGNSSIENIILDF